MTKKETTLTQSPNSEQGKKESPEYIKEDISKLFSTKICPYFILKAL